MTETVPARRSDYEIALDILAHAGESMRGAPITHRFALDDVAAAFRAAADKASGAIKASVRPA